MSIDDEIVRHIVLNESCSPWNVMRFSRYSYEETLSSIHRLQQDGKVRLLNGKLFLPDKSPDVSHIGLGICPSCEDKIVTVKELSSSVFQKWNEISASRPAEAQEYTQYHVTDNTSLARAALIAKRSLSDPLRVSILGDDDLTSIALAIIKPSASIVVLEIDERIIQFINGAARKHNLNIEAYSYNALEPLPERFRNRFNSFFTDPAPTADCLELFVSRLVDSLVKEAGLVTYVSAYPNHHPCYYYLDYQRLLTDMGLFISLINPAFAEYNLIEESLSPELAQIANSYPKEGRISFAESMIELTTTEGTKSTIRGRYKGNLSNLLGF